MVALTEHDPLRLPGNHATLKALGRPSRRGRGLAVPVSGILVVSWALSEGRWLWRLRAPDYDAVHNLGKYLKAGAVMVAPGKKVRTKTETCDMETCDKDTRGMGQNQTDSKIL